MLNLPHYAFFRPSSLAPNSSFPFPRSLARCTAAPLQCLCQFPSFLGARCQLRPTDQILAADDGFHPTFSCPASASVPPCFPQFFAGAGVVPACVCWSICCVSLSVVLILGSAEQMVRYVSPPKSMSATKCSTVQDVFYCRRLSY